MTPEIRLITVEPGHFHAALVQKEMYPGVSRRVHVFAPLGPDLYEHLKRIEGFNTRRDRPTAWDVEVHASPDFYKRFISGPPGNVVVLSGRNSEKIRRISDAVDARLHVLADKPWILKSRDLPLLESVLARADASGLVAYDIMTERFEITSILQRELVSDRAVFGEIARGTERDPAVYMESVHYLMKTVAGAPNIRPSWFFDIDEEGEGLNDVGTHLVDLVQWTLFAEQSLDYRHDVRVVAAQRWPTMIKEPEFRRVTGLPGFPPTLAGAIRDGHLEYFCNTLVSYTLRGIHVKLNVIWDREAPAGSGDTHYAYYKGSRSRIEVRQTSADKFRAELYVVPNDPAAKSGLLAAIRQKLASRASAYPGVTAEDRGNEIHVAIPDSVRVGHEAHFAEVMTQFLRYLRDRSALPQWERPNMMAKYYVTTKGTELSRKSPPSVAPRLAPK